MNGDEAKRLGEKLLAEVQVKDLSSVPTFHFNIAELDALIPGSKPPILELVSPPLTHDASGSGKTSLLYLIIATAILPRTMSCIQLDGHESAVILFDPLHHFSVVRLAEVTLHVVMTKLQAASVGIDSTTKQQMREVVKTALSHVHIFHPPSWPLFLATLRSLPDYLFDATKHHSTHRRIHSIILEDVDAFVPEIRSSAPASSFSSSTSSSSANALSPASSTLAFHLTKLSSLLSSAVITTSHSTSPLYYRPALPTSWPRDTLVTRLALRRVPVAKFAPGISNEEAEAEREKRWEVVSRARFECWKVGMGVGGQGSGGFVFRIGRHVETERKMDI
ncbi:uncharacterized protein SETTUDRAFT_103468 [Exserohilum turcica Et28A]|uniref:DNA recombination and repair protein Rad51-like C-terminal domain-containing protein n=1 Tax=Exserohilum turcicum (strain 28A) TaxID=671987 RepID=R0KLS2_EXST2|nr:uncharacterized protein SETTUDRAFT_103468 [Exserohilum turcica Et28A]EOA90059.1 hypothetical protein SETTUDRAFT_103468 [Exserohilum turcica Et28A]